MRSFLRLGDLSFLFYVMIDCLLSLHLEIFFKTTLDNVLFSWFLQCRLHTQAHSLCATLLNAKCCYVLQSSLRNALYKNLTATLNVDFSNIFPFSRMSWFMFLMNRSRVPFALTNTVHTVLACRDDLWVFRAVVWPVLMTVLIRF